MAENTTDRRVRKTRGQLRQGLVRLMREKSIQDITVKELCEECDINRGTFYLHYTDVYQLLHSIEDELLVEFERVLDGLTAQSVLAAATPSPAMCSMFELLADKEQAMRIHASLHRLKEPYREVFTLRVLGELHFRDIADLFGKSESWAKVTFYRAKDKLIEDMEEHHEH